MSEIKETYWSNGQLKSRINYNNNGLLNGSYETWHENGQQKEKSNFVNDQWHGSCERWHENGQQQCGYVMSSGHFVVEQNIKGIDK